MSEKVAAVLLSFGLLGGMFLWVPILEFFCPKCNRFFRSRRQATRTFGEPEVQQEQAAKVA